MKAQTQGTIDLDFMQMEDKQLDSSTEHALKWNMQSTIKSYPLH
jgi:hypothetical protein